jgi:hypothetical protein
MSDKTDDMVTMLLKQAKENYESCPRYKSTETPKFTRCVLRINMLVLSEIPTSIFYRVNTRFATVTHNKAINLSDDILSGTISNFYNAVKSRGWLPERCVTTPSISLRLYAYEDELVRIQTSLVTLVDPTTQERRI